MEIVEFTVSGRPVPFKRHEGKGRRAWNPAEYTAWKDAVGWAAKLSIGGEPVTCDVALLLRVRLQDGRHGDLDNYIKAVNDGMEGVVFVNDKQVRLINAEMYIDDVPGVNVVVAVYHEEARNMTRLKRLWLRAQRGLGKRRKK